MNHTCCLCNASRVVEMNNLDKTLRDSALDLVDLERYPIADLSRGRGAAFLKDCQNKMEQQGWCSFDGFIKPEALAALATEANGLLPHAEHLTIRRTIYQTDADEVAVSGDANNKAMEHHSVQLADDQIPADTAIQRLYKSELLTDFVRQVQKKSVLYRCTDEFQALNIVAIEPGNWHAWHYDVTECTVTLLLQAAEEGGEFMFLPNCRTDDGEDRETVDRFMAGDLSVAKTFSRGGGTFTLFRGGYSLHGVTKVEKSRPRITAIFTYSEDPNSDISDDINIRIYGERVERILAARRSAKSSLISAEF